MPSAPCQLCYGGMAIPMAPTGSLLWLGHQLPTPAPIPGSCLQKPTFWNPKKTSCLAAKAGSEALDFTPGLVCVEDPHTARSGVCGQGICEGWPPHAREWGRGNQVLPMLCEASSCQVPHGGSCLRTDPWGGGRREAALVAFCPQ